MSNQGDQTVYYIPHSGWYPVALAAGIFFLMAGLGVWLNDLRAAVEPSMLMFFLGAGIVAIVLFAWYGQIIAENQQGKVNAQLKRSYVWGMSWFIFSEFMFFAAFFGALFYARNFAVAWLGGEGDKALTGDYLWPDFAATWPVIANPDPSRFANPDASMASPGYRNWGSYLPFWNTVILLTSSVTVHLAHSAIKNNARVALLGWLGLTVILGVVFLVLQGQEYIEAYRDLGLTLGSGIYGSTFFLLTGFHGFHVTLGTFILLVQWLRGLRGHFTAQDCFGFEAASWYWHFVDVVWLCLFILVYVV